MTQAGIFIIYLTSCANDFCKEKKRTTVSARSRGARLNQVHTSGRPQDRSWERFSLLWGFALLTSPPRKQASRFFLSRVSRGTGGRGAASTSRREPNVTLSSFDDPSARALEYASCPRPDTPCPIRVRSFSRRRTSWRPSPSSTSRTTRRSCRPSSPTSARHRRAFGVSSA